MVKLETCRRGQHVNRQDIRVSLDRFGNKHTEEWHVCQFCKSERKHATRRVILQEDAQWRMSR